MGMSAGGGGRDEAVPHINVTPLIDVLLVLLINCMVITPVKPSKFEAKVPAEPKDQQNIEVKPNPLTLVVAINRNDRTITLNSEAAGSVDEPDNLINSLKNIFTQREQNDVRRGEQTRSKRRCLSNRLRRSSTATSQR